MNTKIFEQEQIARADFAAFWIDQCPHMPASLNPFNTEY
jgi:hypothetical protein